VPGRVRATTRRGAESSSEPGVRPNTRRADAERIKD
jgi:hypothetical protein